jgi:hypothetical protein
MKIASIVLLSAIVKWRRAVLNAVETGAEGVIDSRVLSHESTL